MIYTEKHKHIIRMRDVEKKKFSEIGQFYGVKSQRASQLYREASRIREHKENQHPFYGLTYRAINICMNLGVCSKEEVKAALEDGLLKIGRTRNYGWKTHQELCAWAGLPVPTKPKGHPRICPHCKKSLL